MPLNILDNVNFGMFIDDVSDNRYKLPSRTYMSHTVIPSLFVACEEIVTKLLMKRQYISLTTDAWRSFNRKSYITVTAHTIIEDEKGLTLHNIVLDTSEIIVRHTYKNLFEHVNKVLVDYNLEQSKEDITINYNAVNHHDIHSETLEREDEVDYLREVNYYSDEDDNEDVGDDDND